MLYSKQNSSQKSKAKSSLTGYTRQSVRKGIQNRMLCDEKVQTGFINTEEIILRGFSRTTQMPNLWSYSNISNMVQIFYDASWSATFGRVHEQWARFWEDYASWVITISVWAHSLDFVWNTIPAGVSKAHAMWLTFASGADLVIHMS